MVAFPRSESDKHSDSNAAGNSRNQESAFALTEVDASSTSKPPLQLPQADHQEIFITELMSLLNQEKLVELKRAFEMNDDEGLELKEFIHVMSNIMRMEEGRYTPEQFAANLIEFFDQVDINGDGSMEWEEFTSFIVEMGMSSSDHQPDAIQKYTCTGSMETGNHNSYVHRISYFPKADTVGVVDCDSDEFRIYSSGLELLATIKVGCGEVRCIAYIDQMNQYVVSTTDMALSFYDAHNFLFVKQFRTPTQNTTCMTWISSRSLLVTGDTKGGVRAWNVVDMEEAFEFGLGTNHHYDPSDRHHKHRDIVLDVTELEGLDIIASASIDRTIRLWDLTTGKHRRTLLGHAKGIRKLSYSTEYRFLISVGFDFDVFVWNPYVANLILRLHDHGCSLCGVEILNSTPILITADIEGTFKIWDMRNFTCVQTFRTEENRTSSFCGFVSIHSSKRLVGVGRKMTFFDYEKIEQPELTDEMPIVTALYNPTTFTFITVSNKFVKIWDATKGNVVRVYRNLCESDITAMCLDFRQRKFILGDHDGNLNCFDFLNGANMKDFAYDISDGRAHLTEISKLAYCDEHATVISVSWDRTICIHDESEAEEGVLLRRITGGHRADITALAYSHNLSLIATGSADGVIKVWDYEFVRLEASLYGHSSAITCIFFLEPYPAFLSADASGNVFLWATRPSRQKNKILMRFKHRPSSKNGGRPSSAAITCMTSKWKFAEKKFKSDRRGSFQVQKMPEEMKGEAENVKRGFAESTLNTGHHEDAERWMERLRKLTKNRYRKLEKEDDKQVSEYMIYAGDERGNIVIWDIMPTLESLQKQFGYEFSAIECPIEVGNAKRHIQVDASSSCGGAEGESGKSISKQGKLRQGDGNVGESREDRGRAEKVKREREREDPDENSSINNMNDSVSITKIWKAHTDSINSLQLIEFPEAILSAGNDRMSKLWDVTGIPKGVLRQGGTHLWNFDYDKIGTYEKKIKEGGEIMDEVMEMGELEIDSASDEESDVSEDLMDDFKDDGGGRGGGESESREDKKMYRTTPKRQPIDARTVGRTGRRRK